MGFILYLYSFCHQFSFGMFCKIVFIFFLNIEIENQILYMNVIFHKNVCSQFCSAFPLHITTINSIKFTNYKSSRFKPPVFWDNEMIMKSFLQKKTYQYYIQGRAGEWMKMLTVRYYNRIIYWMTSMCWYYDVDIVSLSQVYGLEKSWNMNNNVG